MKRREFIRNTGLAAAAGLLTGPQLVAAENRKGVDWPIGCFNRPWLGDKNKWGFEVALDGIKAAGYKRVGLLTRTKSEPFIGADATPEYLASLKRQIAARGLAVNMGALRTQNELPLELQIKAMRQQIDNAKTVGVEFLLTFGIDQGGTQLENYYKLMQDAAAYAQERGLKVVLKPHGGASGAADEIVRCLDQVKHPNFKIWFDAGNIIYYTGKDPVEQLRPIARHVTGFCAKDCDKQRGTVWLEFGKGKVDFPAVFKVLKNEGYNGPVMVECCALGDTPELVTENARKNLQFLQRVFADL